MAAAILDTAVFVALAIVTVPGILASLLARRLASRSDIPLKEDLRRSFTRGLSAVLPLATIKRYNPPPRIDTLLNSQRFSGSRNHLCTPVSTAEFTGTWIRTPSTTQDKTGNLFILLWCHGGAYCLGHALGNATSLLRVSEIIDAKKPGISLAIFSLEYTLGPGANAAFPTQQRDALAAYRYLVLEQGISPERIVVGGGSAGGHLAISCLLAIVQESLAKPRGALLLCPWVNLRNASPSFETNRHRDFLSKRLLDRCAEAVGAGADCEQDALSLIDFTTRGPHLEHDGHDVFVHDIQTFVQSAAADGASVELQVSPGMAHAWQFGLDRVTEVQFRGLGPGNDVPARVMAGSENIAEGLLTLLG
ncbi:Alpha/Beta hydrolase protein [Aspergillus carlsbadensis]|nr:Alpha/Beta hydrolase protein [Aspergillus carlsbadensis]